LLGKSASNTFDMHYTYMGLEIEIFQFLKQYLGISNTHIILDSSLWLSVLILK